MDLIYYGKLSKEYHEWKIINRESENEIDCKNKNFRKVLKRVRNQN